MHAVRALGKRAGKGTETFWQPEAFVTNPQEGVSKLQEALGLAEPPQIIEGIDIAHLGGQETVASLVSFIDGLPFKPGYRRYRIRTVEGVDDFASAFALYEANRNERASKVQLVSHNNTWLRSNENPDWCFGYDVFNVPLVSAGTGTLSAAA